MTGLEMIQQMGERAREAASALALAGAEEKNGALAAIAAAFKAAAAHKGQPTVILAKTTKGKGVSFMENDAGWHGKAPKPEELETALAELSAAAE